VDDATSRIVGAYFDACETLYGYFRMTEQLVLEYGIPATFLADNRTVFVSNAKKNYEDDRSDRKTQFGYMCKNLGIDIKTTSVAQAKGRVERMWDTLQNRLPLELRLAGIKTIEAANAFLTGYIPSFNEKFALPIPAARSVFIPAPSPDELRLFLSVLTERKIDGGASLRYDRKLYAPTDERGGRVFLAKGVVGTVARTLDGSPFFTVADKTYSLELIPTHEPFSLNFDPSPAKPAPLPQKPKIPSKNHPWRQIIYKNFMDNTTNA
jgi:hypothetical protein